VLVLVQECNLPSTDSRTIHGAKLWNVDSGSTIFVVEFPKVLVPRMKGIPVVGLKPQNSRGHWSKLHCRELNCT